MLSNVLITQHHPKASKVGTPAAQSQSKCRDILPPWYRNAILWQMRLMGEEPTWQGHLVGQSLDWVTPLD